MSIVLNAAPTAWASDTNYASGPANGSATKVDPGAGRFAQGWVPGSTLPAQHINFHLAAVTTALADIISKVSNKVVDGVGGGTYTLTSNLIFSGGNEVRFDNARIISGGALDVDGNLTLNDSSATAVDAGASVTFADVEDLKVSNQNCSYRVTLNAGQIASGPAWSPASATLGLASGGCWSQTTVSSGSTIAFPLPLLPGDDLVTVSARVTGFTTSGHSSLPTAGDRLAVEVISVSGEGVLTSIAKRFDQSASVGAYDNNHSITLASGALDSGTLPHTIDGDNTYWIVIHGEKGANAEANEVMLLSIAGFYTSRSYRTQQLPI